MQAWTGAGIAPQRIPLQLPKEVVAVLPGHRIRGYAYGRCIYSVYIYIW